MDKKALFNEALTSLVEYAASNGNSVTSDDVKLYFKDQIDDESEYRFIYDYLSFNKIKVDGEIRDLSDSIYNDITVDDAADGNVAADENTSAGNDASAKSDASVGSDASVNVDESASDAAMDGESMSSNVSMDDESVSDGFTDVDEIAGDVAMDSESAGDNFSERSSSKDNKSKESKEELDFIEMYMSEMNAISHVSDSEKSQLTERLLAGDTSVVHTLTEAYLGTVARMAEDYRGQGVTYGDLIQEGNVALLLAISDYNSKSGDFDTFVKRKISAAMETEINTQLNSDRVGQHLADKLNQLDKVTKKLSEKLGRTPEVRDISQAMGISEDEVSQLLKTSLDTLSVDQGSMPTDDMGMPTDDTGTSANGLILSTDDADVSADADDSADNASLLVEIANKAQNPDGKDAGAAPLEWRVRKK